MGGSVNRGISFAGGPVCLGGASDSIETYQS
jgi:hypothetical protein